MGGQTGERLVGREERTKEYVDDFVLFPPKVFRTARNGQHWACSSSSSLFRRRPLPSYLFKPNLWAPPSSCPCRPSPPLPPCSHQPISRTLNPIACPLLIISTLLTKRPCENLSEALRIPSPSVSQRKTSRKQKTTTKPDSPAPTHQLQHAPPPPPAPSSNTPLSPPPR